MNMNNPVTWFYDHGIHVFPTHNKIPAIPKGTSWIDYRCTRAQASHFREYGEPLGALAVVDADRAETKDWVRSHLDTPFTVTTGPYHDGTSGRGQHLYFRTNGKLPPSIRRDGLSIENRNHGAYVVGPGSLRPDGVLYTASDWSWKWDDIPYFPADFVFDDGTCGNFSGVGEAYEFPERVGHGDLHRELFRLLRSGKGLGWDKETTHSVVLMANAQRCFPPLVVDETFDRWFDRGWHNRDRPFTPVARPDIPDRPLEPQTATVDYDLESD